MFCFFVLDTQGWWRWYFLALWQVIQHLQPKGSSGFANVGTFLNEVHRVLKPKGAVVINTCTPEQGATANWFLQLISEHLQKEYEIM